MNALAWLLTIPLVLSGEFFANVVQQTTSERVSVKKRPIATEFLGQIELPFEALEAASIDLAKSTESELLTSELFRFNQRAYGLTKLDVEMRAVFENHASGNLRLRATLKIELQHEKDRAALRIADLLTSEQKQFVRREFPGQRARDRESRRFRDVEKLFGFGAVGSFIESNDLLSAVTVHEMRKKLELTKEQNSSIDVVAADSIAQAADVIRFSFKQHRTASNETTPGDASKIVQSTFDVIQADDQQFHAIVSKRIAGYLADTSDKVNEILTDVQKTQLQSEHYRWLGLRVLLRVDVQRMLKLSGDQTQKVGAILSSTPGSMRPWAGVKQIETPIGEAVDRLADAMREHFEETAARHHEHRKKQHLEIWQLLSAAQREQFNEIAGVASPDNSH